MSDSQIEKAIEVETTIQIEWGDLGRAFADEVTSEQQAEFIMGFYESVEDRQLAWIGSEKIFQSDRSSVADLIENLAHFIREGGKP